MVVDLPFYVLLKQYHSHISRWEGDNERTCAIKPHLQLEKFPPPACCDPGIAESVASA